MVNRNEDYFYRKGDWVEVLEAARETVGKEALEKEPSAEFKQDMMVSEHSPIRCLTYRWRWHNIKYWVTGHLVRHMWEPFVKSQRDDRNGMTPEERDNLPQGAMVQMIGEANAQHVIDTSRKRLCHMAHPQTRAKWVWVKNQMKLVDPEVAFVMVPNCIYRAGCPEKKSCGLWYRFMYENNKEKLLDIRKRYLAYQDYCDKWGE